MDNEYQWIPFYEEFADKLLGFYDKRDALFEIVRELSETQPFMTYLHFERDDWWEPRNYHIDPFSVLATFNRGTKNSNRTALAKAFAEVLGILSPIPEEFDGIPVVDNRNSFFGDTEEGVLWELFAEALKISKENTSVEKFTEFFDKSINGIAMLTCGLYWIRPKKFMPLDANSRKYISDAFDIDIIPSTLSGHDYLNILMKIELETQLTFPEISNLAWTERGNIEGSNYTSGISVGQWQELLDNPSVFDSRSLEIMKRFKDSSGAATCTQLATKYGELKNFYSRGSSALAERIHRETNCDLFKVNGKPQWWRILYTGEPVKDSSVEGSTIWQLRDELSAALDQVDLSDIQLFANPAIKKDKTNTKELLFENFMDYDHDQANYWWVTASPKIWNFSEIKVGESINYTKYNENGNRRKIIKNYNAIKEGDLIVGYESSPELQIVALGTIAYTDDEIVRITKQEELIHPISYNDLKEINEIQDMEFFSGTQGSLFKLTREEFYHLMDLIREDNPIPEVDEIPSYGKEELLSEVFINEGDYDTLVNLLKRKKNIILQGSPGVGKTFLARRLAHAYMGMKDDNRIGFVQFHQNYTYEDFVIGYKPEEDAFVLKNGKFVEFCIHANNNPTQPYFFIIDEINRGNISKIFGELLVAIESDYRDVPIELAYKTKKFSVPSNVYIIGMMNTADRSLAMIDYALRRRFSFFEMQPGFDSFGFKEYQAGLDSDNFNRVVEVLKNLNETISLEPSLGSGFQLGHSYLITDTYEDALLMEIINYEIVPMLQEYWFDDADQVGIWHEKLLGAIRND
ncbi:AAA family ATPase [Jeotgalibaca sp. A122]|uniref:AAA family ATPase n=1 Tax=Jeotgalibaca sp. A122 TaxID=3457322 RepID=UPI003FD1BAB3